MSGELKGNIQITPVSGTPTQYPLAIVEGKLAWKEGPWLSRTQAPIDVPVEIGWPVMTPGGMGETKRVGNNSIGNAFTVGIDATAYGFARLAPKRITVTPTVAPVDKPTKGFETAQQGDIPTPVTMTALESGVSSTQAADIIAKKLTSGSSAAGEEALPVSHTRLTELESTTVATSYATSSVSPAGNRLLLVTVFSRQNSGSPAVPSGVTGNGLTWEMVASQQILPGPSESATVTGMLSVWRSMGASPSSGAITATFAASQQACKISVSEFANVDTGGSNGSSAVVQSATNSDSSDLDLTVTLSAFGSSGNATFGAFAAWRSGNTDCANAGAGFTNISHLTTTNLVASLGTQWQASANTGVSRSTALASVHTWAGIALEIQAAVTGGVGLSVVVTNSIAPSANNLVIAVVHGFRDAGASAAPTLAGAMTTWTNITSQVFDTDHRISIYRALQASPSAAPVTITFAAAQDSVRWSIVEFANVDTGGTNGADAVVQSAAGTETGATTFDAITLSAFGSADNATFGAYASNSTAGMTPESSWTELHDVPSGGGLMTMWRPDNDTTPTATTPNSANWGGLALEIKASVPAGTYETGSFTPTKDRLILAAVHNTVTSPGTPTLSGFNLTWVEVDSETTGAERVTLFRAMAKTEPEAGTVTIDFAGTAQDNVRWSIAEFDGVLTSGDNGADAVVQSVTDTASSSATLSITLAALAEVTNATYGAFATTVASASAGSAYEEIHEETDGGETLLTEWAQTGSVTVDASTSAGASTPGVDGSSEYTDDSASATSHTWSHTNTAGNYLLVGVSCGDATDRISGVTYDGIAMTRLADTLCGTGPTNTPFVALYGLSSPATGANNIVVSLSANRRLQGGAVSVTNMGTITATPHEATGNSTTPSVTVTSTSGDLVFAVLGWNDEDQKPTAGASETERFESTNDASAVTNAAGYTEAATGASTVIAPTLPASAAWGMIGVAISGGSANWAGIGIEIQAGTEPGGFTGDTFVYALNGQHNTKMSVSATPAITVEAQHDFGAAASCGGNPAYYGTSTLGPFWYLPLGRFKTAEVLTSVASSGDDTYEEMTVANGYSGNGNVRSQAFTVSTRGTVSALYRAFDGNKVDVSTDGKTFGDDFDVGTAAETIQALIDSGAVVFIGTDSNLHQFDTTGVSFQLTRFNIADTALNHGSGMLVPEGSEVCFFPHGGLFYWNGERPIHVGVDANPLNQAIPNVDFEPHRVEYTEVVYGSDDWLWASARAGDKTYVFAINRRSESLVWHTIDRFDGTARLIPIDGALDSNHRLWFADITGGKYGFYQLGPNGEPDAGRDTLGHGAASTTYQMYFPRTDWGFPHDLKQLQSLEIKTLNTDATTPVQLNVFRDQGEEESVGATITDAGVDERFWTLGTNDTAYDTMFMVEVATTSGFSTDTDWQLFSLFARGKFRPKMTREVEFTVDTSRIGNLPDDPESLRTKLEALVEANPPSVIDPDGNTINMTITTIDVQPRVPDTQGEIQYYLTAHGFVWKTS